MTNENQTTKIDYTKHYAESFQAVLNKIKGAKKIALLAHERPDEDAVAACLAMYEYITLQLGKTADVVCDARLGDRIRFLPGSEHIITPSVLEGYDLLIAFDCGDFTRIAPKGAAEKSGAFLINIDHHPQGEKPFGSIAIVEPAIAATCQLLFYFFTWAHAAISKNMATNLMAGMVYDTGRFQHANTTPDVLRIASELLTHGAVLPKVVHNIFHKRSFATLQLWGRALSRVKIHPKTQMVMSVITKKDLEETGASVEDLSGLIAIINSVEGSRFALLLTQEAADTIKGSLRSEEYKGVDVSRIAKIFGGGGHKLASGFTVAGQIETKENNWQVT